MNEEALTLVEKTNLQYHEERIEKGKSAFVSVAASLLAIRDERLYRSEFATFEDYCQKRWGFTRRYADQVIGSAEATKQLPADLRTIVLTEGVAREVAKVAPTRRVEVITPG